MENSLSRLYTYINFRIYQHGPNEYTTSYVLPLDVREILFIFEQSDDLTRGQKLELIT